ncbi:hypothetical protein [Allofournierella sp.]|uniref:hypothetical protein n=1 Tax=Allofournierella sp. TaxID=1940256 RepID=UPI003AB3FEAB
MRKAKFLLTLAMAAAVTSTAAMSFAKWDVTTATATGTVTMAKPVTISAEGGATYSTSTRTELGDTAPTYTSEGITVKADLAGMPDGKTANLTLAPEVKKADGTSVTSDFTIVVKEGSNPVADNTDKNVEATNTYTVELTPTEAAMEDAGKGYLKDGTTALTVEVTATLTAVASAS